jgi:DNA-binding LacI/PurR family transcriptional regulator
MSSIVVAKHAGVSVATVSRVLNAPEVVAPETVALVKRAMVELNYTPPPPERKRGPKPQNARPKQAKTKAARIGLWSLGTPESEIRTYFSTQLETLHFALAEANMELKLLFSAHDRVPEDLTNGGISGIIIQGQEPTAKCLRELARHPNVWLMTRRSNDYPGDYVEPDNYANGRLAADWLASRKAKHWLSFSMHPDNPVHAQRCSAFLERAGELHLPARVITGFSEKKSTPPDQTIDGTLEAVVDEMLAHSPAIDGVYMPHDRICAAFFRALRRRRKQPERFHIILGHYNHLTYDCLHPRPAVIDINMRAIIRHAVLQLSDRIKNPEPDRLPVGIKISPILRHG